MEDTPVEIILLIMICMGACSAIVLHTSVFNIVRKNTREKENKNINALFKIIYFPRSKIYLVKYKNKFLRKMHCSKFYGLEEFVEFAEYFYELNQAITAIELYKEQQFKSAFEIIDYKKE